MTLPSGRLLPVTPLELIAVLKQMAFADRYPPKPKTPTTPWSCCTSSSDGVYGEEVWDDESADTASDFDHESAGANGLGRRGIHCFTPDP